MNVKEFQAAAFLLSEGQVCAITGYAAHTVRKLADVGVLQAVKLRGATKGKFRKRQVAHLIGVAMGAEVLEFTRCAHLLTEKQVTRWTGYCGQALDAMVRAGGLTRRRPAGSGTGKFLKAEIAELIGYPELV